MNDPHRISSLQPSCSYAARVNLMPCTFSKKELAYRRQQELEYRTLMKNLIKDIETQIDCKEPSENGKRITCLFEIYSEWKQYQNDKWAEWSLERQTLSIMGKLCAWWQINDSSLVLKILDAVFQHIRRVGFYRLLDQILWEPHKPSSSRGNYPFFSLKYFLAHATQSRFSKNGYTLADMILFPRNVVYMDEVLVLPTVQENNTAIFKLCLRYGACQSCAFSVPCSSSLWNRKPPLLQLLRNYLWRIWWYSEEIIAEESDPTEISVMYPRNDTHIRLQLLLEAIPYVPKGLFNFRRSSEGQPLSEEEIEDFIGKMHSQNMILCLRERYMDPPELKHLCRCQIRQLLLRNFQLPLGIYEMGLPKPIIKYLDLDYK